MSEQTGGKMLEAWRVKEGRYKSWLASKIGVDMSTLSRWVSGETLPQRTARLAIESVTGGAVPVSAWEVEGE